jgi:NADH dehydrogenase
MGITVKLNVLVSDFDGEKVMMKDGSSIAAESLVWAAGVTGQEFLGLPTTAYGRGKRLLVDEYNELAEHKDIFAIGDACLQLADKNYPNGHPQMAQPALQQGSNLANNLKARSAGKPQTPFRYKDKGSMAIIGLNKAVADLPEKIHLHGFIASCMWIFVHLMSLVNYRNKIRTLYNWGVAYVTRDLPLRMIIRPKR